MDRQHFGCEVQSTVLRLRPSEGLSIPRICNAGAKWDRKTGQRRERRMWGSLKGPLRTYNTDANDGVSPSPSAGAAADRLTDRCSRGRRSRSDCPQRSSHRQTHPIGSNWHETAGAEAVGDRCAHVLVDVSSGSIEKDVPGDVCLHRLGHEHARALLLIEAVLMAQIATHLRPARLVAIAAVHARPRWHEWIV